MNLVTGEKILVSSNQDKIILTNYRVVMTDKE
jgi:hypothetical protein